MASSRSGINGASRLTAFITVIRINGLERISDRWLMPIGWVAFAVLLPVLAWRAFGWAVGLPVALLLSTYWLRLARDPHSHGRYDIPRLAGTAVVFVASFVG